MSYLQDGKPVTLFELGKMRAEGRRIAMLTAYDATMAALVDMAGKLGKPIVLEEFGMNRDGGSFDPASGVAVRDRFYRAVYGRVLQRMQAGDAMAGSNFWAWGGRGRTGNADWMWKAGDPFTGDPPQEAQGLFSLFDSDGSTLGIVTAHARAVRALPP